MKEYIKKFESISAADGWVIDNPFISTIVTPGGGVINLTCNTEGKKLKVTDDQIIVVNNTTNTRYSKRISYNTIPPDNIISIDPLATENASNMNVIIETSAMSSSEIEVFEGLLPAGMKIEDFYYQLSYGDVYNRANTRSRVVVGDALPGNYTFLTGFSIMPVVPIDFSSLSGFTIDVIITLPVDVKNVIKLYRNTGNGWNEISSSTRGNGINSVDFSSPNQITIKLSKLDNMHFVIGLQIDQSDPTTNMESFVSGPIVNSDEYPIVIQDMSYEAKSHGIVITNLTQSYLAEYLHKIILRYYSLQMFEEAKLITQYYDFTLGYSLPSNGQLFLAGFQNVITSVFSIVNGTSSFRVDEYGDVFVYPYTTYPEPTTGDGSND